jgi:hypothetical protein
MNGKSILTLTVCCAAMLPAARAADNNRTMRGWFVDEACTRGRVAQGRIEPDNPECAKRCVKEGSKLMFMSETDKALFEVQEPASQAKNIGYYVEISGSTDGKKMLTVNAVKQLAEVGSICFRPKLKSK